MSPRAGVALNLPGDGLAYVFAAYENEGVRPRPAGGSGRALRVLDVRGPTGRAMAMPSLSPEAIGSLDRLDRPWFRIIAAALVLAALASTTTLLTREYKLRRELRAERAASRGLTELAADRTDLAVTFLREAVQLAPDHVGYRLDLARALVAIGNLDEATTHLRDVLSGTPVDGTANLLLARIERARGRVEDAEAYYYRAIYGQWPPEEQNTRLEARLEFIAFLRATAPPERVRAELPPLASAFPGDLTLNLRVAGLLMEIGFPDDAAFLYRDIVRRFANPESAFAGLAEAEMARGDFAGAFNAARRAVQRDPKDEASLRRRELAAAVLSLDPTQPRLTLRERANRTRALLMLARARILECRGDAPQVTEPELFRLVDAWVKESYQARDEDFDLGLNLVEAMARETVAACPEMRGDRPLDLLLRALNSEGRTG